MGKSTVIRRGLKRPLAAPVVIAQDDKDNRGQASVPSLPSQS